MQVYIVQNGKDAFDLEDTGFLGTLPNMKNELKGSNHGGSHLS